MGVEDSARGFLCVELDCGWLCALRPSDGWTVSPSQAGTRFPTPSRHLRRLGHSTLNACVYMCEPLCFCVWRYSVCESHPLTAGAELSLIQLCLLSCLLAALPPPRLPLPAASEGLAASGFSLGLRIAPFQPSLLPAW